MARKAKDILLARGYTEADLTSMSTLLADAKFCAAIEAEAAETDTLREQTTKLQKDLEDDAKWYQETAVPALNKAVKDATEAREKQAAVEAKLKAAQDYGLMKVAENDKPATPVPTTPPSSTDLDPTKFVSAETFAQTTSQFGSAIAMAQDIADDHRELFGSRLPGGVSKLREEYQEAVRSRRFGGSLQQFWEQQYKVADRRKELETAARQKEISDAVAAEKTKWVSEQANPMTRTLSSSRNPFTNRTQSQTADGKPATSSTSTPSKPWEKSDSERASQRVSKFANKVLQSA